jgi:DNA-binding NarL/FixJ family response regulator
MNSIQWENPIRVLVVEDEPLWQQGIRALLESHDQYRLVGIADDYASAISLFESQKPQLILLDWKLRGERDGLAVGEWFLQQGIRPEQVVLISSSSPSSIPPHPFFHLPKSRLSEELLPLLHSVTVL